MELEYNAKRLSNIIKCSIKEKLYITSYEYDNKHIN